MEIIIQRVSNENAAIPKYESRGAAGFDLQAYDIKKYLHIGGMVEANAYEQSQFKNGIPFILKPFHRAIFGTGVIMQLPTDTHLEIRSRSGATAKEGLIVLNGPGTIDEDYRGEVMLIMYNSSPFDTSIKKGDRIAQGVLMSHLKANIYASMYDLPSTERGQGGLGSTGK